MCKLLVRIAGLREGEHLHNFLIKDKFFEAYHSEVKSGEFVVNVLLNAKGKERKLNIEVEGKINNLLCDCCAEEMELTINTTAGFVIKESDQLKESLDEVIYVLPHQHVLEIDQIIFEMIVLAIPSKKFHQKEGKISCNKKMLHLLEKYAQKEEQNNDPRWDALKNLKTNKTKENGTS